MIMKSRMFWIIHRRWKSLQCIMDERRHGQTITIKQDIVAYRQRVERPVVFRESAGMVLIVID